MATNPLPLTVKTPAANSVPNRAQQIARAQAIPSVPGAPQTRERNPLKQFGLVTIVLLPNAPFPISIQGDYLFIQNTDFPLIQGVGAGPNLSGAFVTVKDSNGNVFQLDQAGKGYIFPQPFESVALTMAPGAVAQLRIQVYVGFGRVQDDSGVRAAVGVGRIASQAVMVRPANVTPYAAGQVVSDAITFTLNNVARMPLASAIITKVIVAKSSANLVNANFSLWLFQESAFPTAQADQSAFVLNNVNMNFLMGKIDLPAFITGGAGSSAAICEIDGIAVPFTCDNFQLAGIPALDFAVGGSLSFLLVANGAYVPTASEIFGITLFTDKY